MGAGRGYYYLGSIVCVHPAGAVSRPSTGSLCASVSCRRGHISPQPVPFPSFSIPYPSKHTHTYLTGEYDCGMAARALVGFILVCLAAFFFLGATLLLVAEFLIIEVSPSKVSPQGPRGRQSR